MLPNGQESELADAPHPPLPETQLNVETPIETATTPLNAETSGDGEEQKSRARSATPRKRAKRLPKGAVED